MTDIQSASSQQAVQILGLPIDSLTPQQALARFEVFLDEGGPHQLATVNPEFVVLAQDDPVFRQALLGADMRLADGTGIILASWLLGRPLPSRHPGIDLMVSLCEIAARRGTSVFLLGAGPGIAEQAASSLSNRVPALRIVGAEMGPAPGTQLTQQEEHALLERIGASQASVLFVAFGAPLQETWLALHKERLDIAIVVGVGGSFDVLSGRIPRAPRIMRQLGLEWLFRLIRMPWRWRRQFSRLPRFVGLVLLQALRGSSDRGVHSSSAR